MAGTTTNVIPETVRLRPRDYSTLTALGQTLQKKNDDQAAVVEFQKARRINPAGPAASLGLATSLEKVGRIDDALLLRAREERGEDDRGGGGGGDPVRDDALTSDHGYVSRTTRPFDLCRSTGN